MCDHFPIDLKWETSVCVSVGILDLTVIMLDSLSFAISLTHPHFLKSALVFILALQSGLS